MPKNLLFGLFLIFSPALGLADTPLPIHAGTQWSYEQGESKLDTTVKRLTSIKTTEGTLQVAEIERSTGKPLFLFRSQTQWIECEKMKGLSRDDTCEHPVVILQWPLTVGNQWSSGGYDFLVVGRESVITPFQEYKESFKVAYTTSGSLDPLGQFWFVDGIGRVQIEEGDHTLKLNKFELGSGQELPATPDDVVRAFLEKSEPKDLKLSGESAWKKTWYFLQNSKMFPLLVIQVLILFIFLIVGVILWQALRFQKGMLSKSEGGSVKDESKILSALLRSGEVISVEKRLGELVQKHPNYPDLRHQLALVQKVGGKLNEAQKNLEKALDINPNYLEARLSLGQLFLQMEKPENAKEHFQFVVGLKPTFADAWFQLAKSCVAIGEFKEAEKHLKKVLKLNDQFEEAIALLEDCRKLAQS